MLQQQQMGSVESYENDPELIALINDVKSKQNQNIDKKCSKFDFKSQINDPKVGNMSKGSLLLMLASLDGNFAAFKIFLDKGA